MTYQAKLSFNFLIILFFNIIFCVNLNAVKDNTKEEDGFNLKGVARPLDLQDRSIEPPFKEKKEAYGMLRSSPFISVGIGATVGGFEALATHPLVTLKALWQNNTPLKMEDFYNPKQTLKQNISSAQRLTSILYRGLGANVIGMSSIIATRMVIRDSILAHIFKTEHPSLFQHMVAASGAGFMSAALTTPMELGVTLQQTDELKKKTKSFVSTYKGVIDKFGFRQGFTGLTCVGTRDTLVTASFLTFSRQLKEMCKSTLKMNGIELNEMSLSIFAGVVTGTTCSIGTHPLDTIKTVQQARLRAASKKEECSIAAVMKHIYQERGIKGFYNGVFWRTARVGPHIAIIAVGSEYMTTFFTR